jgi:ABC-type transport system involved in multi-copper enzyme maturation permease subunit
MTSRINIVAKNEFKTLFKEKTFIILLIIFILMTIFSTYIGWSAKNTIINVYQETVKELSLKGIKEIPPNPFTGIPDLSILKNMIVYVFLIGSLLALVIGNSAFIKDRRSGVLRIIFSKFISKQTYIFGKIVGIFETLLLVIFISFLLSLFSTILISGHFLTPIEILKLSGFYAISLVYLLIFSMVGLYFAINSDGESIALLIPVIIWVLITFVIPQITSSLVPTALLNPTNIQAVTPHSNFFHILQIVIRPFSISESYKEISGILLETNSGINAISILQTKFQNAVGLIVMFSYLGISMFGSIYAINKFNSCEEGLSE